MERIADVMEEKVSSFVAHAVLTAARSIREEVCGPVPKKMEHSGVDGKPISISINGIIRE